MRNRPSGARFVTGSCLLEAVEALDACANSAVTAAPWWNAAIETFPSSKGLLVERAGVPVAVLPLIRAGRFAPWLEPVGASPFGEPVSPLATDPQALDELARALASRRLPLELPRIPSDDPFIDALRRTYGRWGVVRVRPTPGCPVVDLQGLSEAEALLGPDTRKTFQKKQRRAQRIGDVSYEVHEAGPDEAPRLFAEVVEVEARSWKRDSGKALAYHATTRAFFAAYTRRAAAAGVLRVAVMRIGGTPAAVQLHAESHSALNQLRIGYDEQFASVSPGQLLMLHVVDWALQRGLQRYEILGRMEPWNKQWKAYARPQARVMTFAPGARSAAALGMRVGWAARYRLGPAQRVVARRGVKPAAASGPTRTVSPTMPTGARARQE
jgi:CelD/BcsL family acetyltransferase involved in cellulose biosynthesis